MKNSSKTFNRALLGLVMGVAVISAAHAVPIVILPTSGFDIPPQQFDQATIYSSSLLAQQQTNGLFPGNTSTFDFATGSGVIPVLVYSNNAVTNPAPFEQPMDAGQSGDFDGTWGISATGTIGALRELLTIGGVKYQPLLVFDHNEQSTLDISGRLAVYQGNTQIVSYAMDTNANGIYDVEARVTSCGDVNIGPGVVPTPDNCNILAPVSYNWGTEGSGKPDYFVAVGAFDLYNPTYLDSFSIVIQMSIRNMDPGFDELGIAAYNFAATTPPTPIPEPGTLALLAIGLVGLGYSRRKQ